MVGVAEADTVPFVVVDALVVVPPVTGLSVLVV
jgi:hypothetical protein